MRRKKNRSVMRISPSLKKRPARTYNLLGSSQSKIFLKPENYAEISVTDFSKCIAGKNLPQYFFQSRFVPKFLLIGKNNFRMRLPESTLQGAFLEARLSTSYVRSRHHTIS